MHRPITLQIIPAGSVSYALVIPWEPQICPATAKLQAEPGCRGRSL